MAEKEQPNDNKSKKSPSNDPSSSGSRKQKARTSGSPMENTAKRAKETDSTQNTPTTNAPEPNGKNGKTPVQTTPKSQRSTRSKKTTTSADKNRKFEPLNDAFYLLQKDMWLQSRREMRANPPYISIEHLMVLSSQQLELKSLDDGTWTRSFTMGNDWGMAFDNMGEYLQQKTFHSREFLIIHRNIQIHMQSLNCFWERDDRRYHEKAALGWLGNGDKLRNIGLRTHYSMRFAKEGFIFNENLRFDFVPLEGAVESLKPRECLERERYDILHTDKCFIFEQSLSGGRKTLSLTSGMIVDPGKITQKGTSSTEYRRYKFGTLDLGLERANQVEFQVPRLPNKGPLREKKTPPAKRNPSSRNIQKTPPKNNEGQNTEGPSDLNETFAEIPSPVARIVPTRSWSPTPTSYASDSPRIRDEKQKSLNDKNTTLPVVIQPLAENPRIQHNVQLKLDTDIDGKPFNFLGTIAFEAPPGVKFLPRRMVLDDKIFWQHNGERNN